MRFQSWELEIENGYLIWSMHLQVLIRAELEMEGAQLDEVPSWRSDRHLESKLERLELEEHYVPYDLSLVCNGQRLLLYTICKY